MNPGQVKNSQKLADFTETIKQGNSMLKIQAGKKIVVTSLPPLKLGQRSVNLVNQLNILQNGGALNLLKKNIIILNEDNLYDEIAEDNENDQITIEVIKPKDQKQVNEGYFKNQIEIIFYLTIAFIIFFLFFMRVNLNLNFIKLNQKQIKMYEANYYEQIQKNLTQKTKVKRDNRKKTYIMKQNKQTDQQKQKLNSLKQQNSQVKQQYNNANEKQFQQISNNPSKEEFNSQTSLNEDDQLSHNSLNSIVSSSRFNPTKISTFSVQKLTSMTQLQDQSDNTIIIPSIIELSINENSSSQTLKYKKNNDTSQQMQYEIKKNNNKKCTSFKILEDLNTIVEDEQDNSVLMSKDDNPIQLSNQSSRNKSKKNNLKFNSMQVIKPKDAEYENHIQENQEKPINPRWQSKKNIQKATKILNKLKRNQQILKESKTLLKIEKDTIQNQKSQLFSETNTSYKNNDQSIKKYKIKSEQQPFNPHEGKLKSNQSHKFLVQLQKLKDTKIQVEQMQKEKLNLQEYLQYKQKIDLNKDNDFIEEPYKIAKHDQITFKESNISIKLKKNKQHQENEKKEKKHPLIIKRRNKMIKQEDHYQTEADQVKESIDDAIIQKQQYIHFIDNLIDQQLKITSKNILQIYSLQQHDDKLLSNRLTKCIYFISQVLLTMTAQIILTQGMSQSVSFNSHFGKFELYLTRILAITAISYSIPYFIFGSLTSIFAQSSKQLKLLDFRSINHLRNSFIICYISLGLMQGILYLLLIYYESKDTLLGVQFTITNHILEVFISFIISIAIIDMLFYLYFNFILNDEDKFKSTLINNILACRGFYYYKGFDNFGVYEQFFLAKTILSV